MSWYVCPVCEGRSWKRLASFLTHMRLEHPDHHDEDAAVPA